MDYVLTFDSTHKALAAESIIIKCGLAIQLIATPRTVDSRCGFSILLKDCSKYSLDQIYSDKKIGVIGLYTRKDQKGFFYYEKNY